MKELERITPQQEQFDKWYVDVVKQGNLIAYGPVKGTIFFKPNSYGLWENIQLEFNKLLKKEGIRNVYAPLLMPESYILKEKDHVKGFAPELATVTRVGKKELDESLIIRPTSEILFADLFKDEVNSYKDLPLKLNQWANVLRWEKTTNPFLRNSEFLWQEGHTAHAGAGEARRFTKRMIRLYAKFLKEYLAIPTVMGKKTSHEKFAGAINTYTIEAMMKNGKALQTGTSHYLGQNFSKAFDIQFSSKENQKEFIYQTSWGISTRLIGAIIMTHGDNRGIIMPPKVAPVQIDIIEIFGDKNPEVRELAKKLGKQLSRKWSVRVDSSDKSPGFKAARSEIQGTPIRIDIGPRDIENGSVTIIRRDIFEKEEVKLEDVKARIKSLLKEIHLNLLLKASKRLEDNIVNADTYEEMKKLVNEGKFVIAPFAGKSKQEKDIKEETGITVRCIPFNKRLSEEKECIITNTKTKRLVMFAKAY